MIKKFIFILLLILFIPNVLGFAISLENTELIAGETAVLDITTTTGGEKGDLYNVTWYDPVGAELDFQVGAMSVASFPMYNLPEVRLALDGLWKGMARNFRREGIAEVPDELVHGRAVRKLWNDPNLFISQCCGYDLVNRYADKLTPLAVPRYGVAECRGYLYASAIVVREDCPADDVLKMRGAVCVINGPESHSGMSSLRALVAPFNSEVDAADDLLAAESLVYAG